MKCLATTQCVVVSHTCAHTGISLCRLHERYRPWSDRQEFENIRMNYVNMNDVKLRSGIISGETIVYQTDRENTRIEDSQLYLASRHRGPRQCLDITKE